MGVMSNTRGEPRGPPHTVGGFVESMFCRCALPLGFGTGARGAYVDRVRSHGLSRDSAMIEQHGSPPRGGNHLSIWASVGHCRAPRQAQGVSRTRIVTWFTYCNLSDVGGHSQATRRTPFEILSLNSPHNRRPE